MWYRTNWGRKKEIRMTEEPIEEGNDQEASEGTTVEAPEEADLEDVPENEEGDAERNSTISYS
jgi:hypothetical protein